MSDDGKTMEDLLGELPEKEDENLGKVIGNRYEVERVLGEGGMGRVYVAVQLSMSRKVALKVLHPQMLSDSRHVRRFYQEAKSASRLTSPHVVRMYDFGIDEDTGTPFIAMELLQGLPLDALLEDVVTLPPVRAAQIVAQVGQALMEAHDLGIVHRDLKPENIFMQQTPGDDDFAKVMDFGIAKVLHSENEEGEGVNLTGTGMTVGTPLYMAPEQIQGGKVDSRTDVYSLGCILHELVMGMPPFYHVERLPLMLMHVQEPPPPLPDVLPAGHIIPDGFRELRDRMLAKDPDDRPGSTGELVQELRRIAKAGAEAVAVATQPIGGGPTVMGQVIPGAATETDPTPGPAVELTPADAPGESTPPQAQAAGSDQVDTTGDAVAAMRAGARKSFRGGLFAGIAVAFIGIGVGVFMSLGKDAGDAQSAPRGQLETTAVTPRESAQPVPVAAAKPDAPTQVKLRITSEPVGATVMRGEKETGETPLDLEMDKSTESISFTLRHEGFMDVNFSLVPDQNREARHSMKALTAAPAPADKKPVEVKSPGKSPKPSAKTAKPRKKAKKARASKKQSQEIDGLLD